MTMTTQPTIPNSFYRAFNLRERADMLAGGHGQATTVELPGVAAAKDQRFQLVALRQQRHQNLAGLSRPGAYRERLAALGLSPKQAQALYAVPDAWLAEHCEKIPPWARLIGAVYDCQEPLVFEGDTLVAAATPLIRYAKQAIEAEAKRLSVAHGPLPFRPDTVAAAVCSQLAGELGAMMERTLVLELHVARLLEQLSGEDSAARFASYLKRLAQPGIMMTLFEEYSVLARMLGTHIEQTIAAAAELLLRLTLDWPQLVARLGVTETPGDLITALGAGDRHDGGRKVMLLRWSSGLELAYKPKPLAADVRFQTFVAWANERGASPPLETLPMLDMGDYGYSVMVQPEPCANEDEVFLFFERQGALLALFYGLLATDFHCENVIAVGQHPYPIDLESLFHAQIGTLGESGVDAVSEADLVFSVLRVGLLPERANANGGAPGLDLSGLGGHEGQLSPQPQPSWDKAGTDAMRLVRRSLPLSGSANRPTLRGGDIQAFDYTEQIVAGFSDMYQLLLRHREALTGEGGLLDGFGDDVVRVIARPTRVYAALLGESYHPDLLRDAVDRDIHFDRLWSFEEGQRQLMPLVAWEQHDLWRGDIPKLTVRAASRTLEHHRGAIAGFFERSGLSAAKEHLAAFGPKDLAHQQWIVRASMVTVATDVRAGRWARYQPSRDAPPRSRQQLVAMAERVAERLADTALRTGEEATWLGLAFAGDSWVLAPLGTDLYGGLLGVILFLAYAAEVTQQQRYRDLAEAATQTLLRKERAAGHLETAIGGYSGLGATVYVLTQLGRLWQREDLIQLASERVTLIEPLVERDESLDILSGCSGALAALLSHHRLTDNAEALALAEMCGERLLTRAVKMDRGVGWPSEETGGRALAGFSHGAAGMAWALLSLYERTGKRRYRHTAMEAIRYERTLFAADEGNYYDLRPEELAGRDAQFSMAWCHGAPGVGLARVSQLHMLDAHAREEVKLTALSTLRSLGRGHSLCHGDLGNLELVKRAASALDDSGLAAQAAQAIGSVVDNMQRGRWLCGVPLSVETPGLMVGLAGMGYQLLRFAFPERVPSVLLLEGVPLADAHAVRAA